MGYAAKPLFPVEGPAANGPWRRALTRSDGGRDQGLGRDAKTQGTASQIERHLNWKAGRNRADCKPDKAGLVSWRAPLIRTPASGLWRQPDRIRQPASLRRRRSPKSPTCWIQLAKTVRRSPRTSKILRQWHGT